MKQESSYVERDKEEEHRIKINLKKYKQKSEELENCVNNLEKEKIKITDLIYQLNKKCENTSETHINEIKNQRSLENKEREKFDYDIGKYKEKILKLE